MRVNIEFFNNNFIDAIGAGVYQIDIEHNGLIEPLYIGESVFVLVRCAAHLYELKKNPNYFGFTDITIQNSDIILKFRLIEKNNDAALRRLNEKKFINEKKPISQSGIRDNQKSIEHKKDEIAKFLDRSLMRC